MATWQRIAERAEAELELIEKTPVRFEIGDDELEKLLAGETLELTAFRQSVYKEQKVEFFLSNISRDRIWEIIHKTIPE